MKATHVGDNGLALSMKIATEPEPHDADARVLRRRPAGREGRHRAQDRRRGATPTACIASPMVQYRGPFVLNMPEEAWFDMKMMQKDTTLALDLGRRLGVPLPTTAVANEFLTAARGLGLDEERLRRRVQGARQAVRSPGMSTRCDQQGPLRQIPHRQAAPAVPADGGDPPVRGAGQRSLHARADAGPRAPLHRRGSDRRRRVRGAADETTTSPARIAATATAWPRARRRI